MNIKNNENPLVSVIVPICNVEPYIHRCLDSIIGQTLKNIEIICVEDHSDDRSAEILKEYADRDNRIKAIFHATNLSTSQARKDGVAVSCGKYIMFVDGDDELCPDACQIASETIEKYGTDMVQFDTEVVNCAGVSEERIQMNQRFLFPCLEEIRAENLIFSCWKEKKMGFSLWNKIFNGEICRQAFADVEDGFYPKAQDLYAFFLIAYYSRSYMGIENRLYRYMFGIGVTGSDYISIPKFDVMMTEKQIWECLVRFIDKKQEQEKYKEILDGIYQHFLADCVSRWQNNLQTENISEGFDHLVDTWGLEDVISKLAERNWHKSVELAEKMVDVDYFKTTRNKGNEIKTIGIYYRSIKNGGAQRVVAALANEWAKMRDAKGDPVYKVVLVTDEETEDGEGIPEYELDYAVVREYIPSSETAVREHYKERYHAWSTIIEKHKIDLMVTGMWVAPCTMWDMLSIKGQPSKPGFIIHAHSFTSVPFGFVSDKFAELMYDYQICDGVVVLSEVDEKYVKCFNPHVTYISNPITFSTGNMKEVKKEENNILWLGRIAKEKQPLDVVYAMEHIVKEFPNIRLHMVGDGDEKLTEMLKNLICQLGLQDNVILEGFTSEVEKYYEKAQLMMYTSEYEGFPMVFCEALSHGTPIVTYDMPWLTFVRDGRGIVTSRQKRPDLLAQKVTELLRNSEECRRLAEEGKQHIKELETVDIGQTWKQFFDTLYEEKEIDEDSVDNVIFRFLTSYAYKGKQGRIKNMEGQITRLKEQKTQEVKAAQRKVKNSETFKVGKTILYVPRKMKKFLKRLSK